MKVVVCQNDIVPARGEAVDVGSPLAGDLRPLSTASASEFIGNTTSLPHSWASAAPNGPSRSACKARFSRVTVSTWA